MVLKSDQQRIKTLLQEAIPLLCKNGLSYQSEFCIEALIGITLDQNDVFLVNINERVCSADNSATSAFHEEGHVVRGSGGDAESVNLSDSISEGDGNSKIKSAQQYRIASQRTFHKQTTHSRNKVHTHGSSISENKSFESCYNDTERLGRQHVNETEVDNDIADSYNVSADSNLGSPPRKKQMCEWGNSTQTYIKQEPDIFEIIDPSDTELEEDFKDPETFSIPATSEMTAVSSPEIYGDYSAGLDILQAPSSLPSTTPGGSNVVATFRSNMLGHSSSLAQALPELSMTSSTVANQSTVGYGLPSFPSNQSNVQQSGSTQPQQTLGGSREPPFSSGATWTESFTDAGHRSADFTCKVCLKCFKCQQNLDDHVNGKHLDSKRFKCRMCGKAFKWRSLLSGHRKKCSLPASSSGQAARQPELLSVSSAPANDRYEPFSALVGNQSGPFAGSSGLASNLAEPDANRTSRYQSEHFSMPLGPADNQSEHFSASSVMVAASAKPVTERSTETQRASYSTNIVYQNKQ